MQKFILNVLVVAHVLIVSEGDKQHSRSILQMEADEKTYAQKNNGKKFIDAPEIDGKKVETPERGFSSIQSRKLMIGLFEKMGFPIKYGDRPNQVKREHLKIRWSNKLKQIRPRIKFINDRQVWKYTAEHWSDVEDEVPIWLEAIRLGNEEFGLDPSPDDVLSKQNNFFFFQVHREKFTWM